ncbi:TPA: hypothetical protein U8251_002130 [Pseudomonas putida]|nr:hypothetical protein [Pseudomonas putida]
MIVNGTITKSPNVVIDYFHKPLNLPEIVAITFTPSGNRVLDGLGFGGKFLLDNKIDLISVKCNNDSWFQTIPEDSFELINQIIENKGYSTIVAYGSSMGGYAAIQFSKRFKCNIVLALSPQFSIIESFDKRWESHAKKVEWKYNISSNDLESSCKYYVFYDPHDLDKEHADRVLALSAEANVTNVAIPFAGHPVSHYLQETGVLKEVALSIFRGDTPHDINLRKNKARSKSYLKNLSVYLHKKDKLALSLSVINKAIELDGESSTYFMHKGTLLESMGRVDDAVEAFERCFELDPNPLIKLRISKILVGEKRFAEALEHIDAGILKSSAMAVLHRQRSEILVGLGDMESAIDSVVVALSHDPKNPFYRIHLSNLYSKQGRFADALVAVDDGITHSPNVSALYRNKIEILKKLGDFEGAKVVSQMPEYAAQQ